MSTIIGTIGGRIDVTREDVEPRYRLFNGDVGMDLSTENVYQLVALVLRDRKPNLAHIIGAVVCDELAKIERDA